MYLFDLYILSELCCMILLQVPRSLYQLVHLQYLNLRSNQISFLDDDLGKLTSLVHLDLGCNMLDEIPVTIGNLKMLTILRVDELCITELPETVADLNSLELLDVSNSKKLESLPTQSLSKLPRMWKVYVFKCDKLLKANNFGSLSRFICKNSPSFFSKHKGPLNYQFT